MFRRSLNVKLALLTACTVMVLGLGVHALHAFQVRRGARGLLALASRSESAGQPEKAREYLARYLALRPDDVAALVRLAELLASKDDSPQARAAALGVYRKALRLAGQRSDIRRRLVDLAVRADDFTEAMPHVEVLLREAPNDGELLFLLGRCQEAAGKVADAITSYEKARKADPTRIEAYTRLAALLRNRRQDADRADRVMDAREDKDGLIAHNGRSAAAYLARARYRTRYAVPGVDAATDVRRALELAPDDADVLLAAADSAREQGRLDDARKLLAHGLEQHPDAIAFYQAVAMLELRVGRPDAALDALKRGFERPAPRQAEAQAALGWQLADTLINLGRTKEAQPLIQQLAERNMRAELLDYLRARAITAESHWADAARQWEQLVPALAAQPAIKQLTKTALLSLGRCYERLGNVDQRYDAYQRAVAIDLEHDPLWVEARLGLAAALLDLNRLNEAIEQYRIVVPRQPLAGLAMARVQVAQNLRRPADEQRWDEVERTLGAVERGTAGAAAETEAAAGVSILRAERLAAQGKLGPARQLLERARDKYPDDPELWIAVANVAGREGKPGDTIDVLNEAARRLGERIELRLARTAYWASHDGGEAEAALAEIERDADKLPAGDRPRLRRALASAYALRGEHAKAQAVWTKLALEARDDLSVRLALFNHALRANDEPAAEESLAHIRRIEEGGPLGHYGQAMLLVRRAKRARDPDRARLLNDARGELQQAAARRPSWGRVVLTRAEVESLSGNADAAIQDFLRAVLAMGERDPAVVTRLLQLLTERGRVAEAAQVVQKLTEERVPLSGDLQRLVAQISYQSGDPGQALKLAQGSVPADSRNADELVWLAQIQWAAGQPAEATLRRAVGLAPKSPKTWLALILYLAGTNQKQAAEEALDKAKTALPPDEAALPLAQASEAVGRADEAGKLYKQAMDEHPEALPTLRAVATYDLRIGRRAEAEQALERIIQLGGTTTDAAWARRVLASVMAIGGDYQRSVKALELLGLSTESAAEGGSPAPAEDVRTKARILAAQPNRARRREAIALVEGLASAARPRPPTRCSWLHCTRPTATGQRPGSGCSNWPTDRARPRHSWRP